MGPKQVDIPNEATRDEVASVGCDAVVLPDMAFALHDHPAVAAVSTGRDGVRYLLRSDAEAPGHDGAVDSVDWRDPLTIRLLRVREMERFVMGRSMTRLADAKAQWRVHAGMRLLDGASCVVTDRLHGMLLARLAQIPVVALDNIWGKVRAFYETWFEPDPDAYWAESLDEAEAFAGELAKT